MRALPFAAALAIACWLGLTPALGATFVLDDGSAIVGSIVQATRNTVTIRPAIGGLRQIAVGRLERVEVTTADGQTLLGRYRGWADGRSMLAVGAELLAVENDRVVERRPLTTPAMAAASAPDAAVPVARAAAPSPPDPTAGSGGPAAGAPSDGAAAPPAPPRRAVSAVVGPLPPHPGPQALPAPEPAAGPAMAALPGSDLPVVSVKTSPEEITGASDAITFTIELSRPLDDLLVVIYSTVDGTARAGADYEPLQGILTLPAGVTSAAIQTTLVERPESGGDKDFQLFLASNPDLVTIAEPWTKVTIHDEG